MDLLRNTFTQDKYYNVGIMEATSIDCDSILKEINSARKQEIAQDER